MSQYFNQQEKIEIHSIYFFSKKQPSFYLAAVHIGKWYDNNISDISLRNEDDFMGYVLQKWYQTFKVTKSIANF